MQLELTKTQETNLKAFAEQIIHRNTQHNLTGYKNIEKLYKEQIIDCVKALHACKTGLEKQWLIAARVQASQGWCGA